jgi:hypothetical protein
LTSLTQAIDLWRKQNPSRSSDNNTDKALDDVLRIVRGATIIDNVALQSLKDAIGSYL